MIFQSFYNCITCGLVDGLSCCEACAKICHYGHQLVPRGVTECYCDCGAGKTETCVSCKCRKVTQNQMQAYTQYMESQPTCTFIKTGEKMVEQELFTCLTCRFGEGTCMRKACARYCHYGHEVRSLGVVQGFCDCGAGNLRTQCRCMNGMPVRRQQQDMPAYEVDACNLQ